jgi:hypothetical protein
MASIRQLSFAGGLFSPALSARNDIAKYASGLKTCTNFFPTVEGALHNRPGTEFIKICINPDQTNRVIPFIYSDDDAYVLEFSGGADAKIRVFKDGELVSGVGGGNGYIDSPYASADIFQIKYAQVGDVLWLTHGDYAPRTLTRYAEDDWELALVSFSQLTDAGAEPWDHTTNYSGLAGTYATYKGVLYETQRATLNDIPDRSPDDWRVKAAPFGGLLPALLTPEAEDIPEGLTAREWIWLVSTIIQDDVTGLVYETAPYKVVETCDFAGTPPNYGDSPAVYTTITSNNWAVYPEKPVTIRWPETAGLLSEIAFDGIILGHRIYRGRGNVFGWIGETREKYFIDLGDQPDYSRPPRIGRNPFEVYATTFEDLERTEEPSAVGFFEQRLVFGRTDERPGWLWLSATGDYLDFSDPLFGGDADSMEFELASMRREEVRSLVGLDKLFVLTSGGLWTVAGNGGPLTRTNFQATKQSDEGASWVSPLVVRDSILYVRSKGIGINEFDFSQERQRYNVNDLSVLVRNLFEDVEVVDWAYAHDPYRLIWVVLSDGSMLTLTYDRSQEVWAWARHETDGLFESVCTVPEGDEDAVYFVVQRETSVGFTGRFIERLHSRRVEDATDGVFLDFSQSFEGDGLTQVTVSAFTGADEFYVVADGQALGWFEVAPGGVIDFSDELPDGADVVHCGWLYTSDLELLDLTAEKVELRAKMKTVSSVVFDVVSSGIFKAGEDFDHLTEARLQEISDGYDAIDLKTGQVKVDVRGIWNRGGRAVLRQENPAPLTILGVTREVEVGGV